MRVAVAILLLLLASPVFGADVEIVTSLYTKHLNGDDGLNETNKAFGVSVNRVFGITFENSHDKRSWYFGYSFRSPKMGKDFYLRGNLHVGALYGYGDDVPNVAGWTLAPAPTLEIGYKAVSVEVLAFPSDGGVIVCLLRYTF